MLIDTIPLLIKSTNPTDDLRASGGSVCETLVPRYEKQPNDHDVDEDYEKTDQRIYRASLLRFLFSNLVDIAYHRLPQLLELLRVPECLMGL